MMLRRRILPLLSLLVIGTTLLAPCGAFIAPSPSCFAPKSTSVSKSARPSLLLFASKHDKDLASFTKFPSEQFDGLSGYIREWSELFEKDRQGMGLTTPVKVTSSTTDEATSIRIIFQPTKTGDAYKSKKEEQAIEEGEAKDEKKKEKGPKKQGGVEIIVEQQGGGDVSVQARRCEVDDDTMIKEMSEETIIKQLNKAINVWKKEHS